MAYLLLDGAGDYASTAHSAALNISGDIDLRAYIEYVDYDNNVAQPLIAKRVSSLSWSMQTRGNSTRAFALSIRTGSTNYFSGAAATHTIPDGGAGWLRFTRVAATGAVAAYESSDGSSWSGLSLVADSIPAGNIDTNTDAVQIGGERNGLVVATGKVLRAQVWDGIEGSGGSLALDADPSDPSTWAGDLLSFTEKANAATVTLVGDAQLVGGDNPLLLLGVG